MYKGKILEALKAKFTGVSDPVLDRIANNLAKTVAKEEDVANAVDGVTIQKIIDSYADSRATEATQTAISNYEKKYGLKDGVKEDKGGDPQPPKTEPKGTEPNTKGGAPEWAEALIKSNNELKERLNAMESAKVTEQRRSKVNELISKLPENLRKSYERIPLTGNEEDFNKLIGDISVEVDDITKDLASKGAVFGRPLKTGAARKDELTKEQLDAISKRGGQKPDEQPF